MKIELAKIARDDRDLALRVTLRQFSLEALLILGVSLLPPAIVIIIALAR